MLLVVPTTRIEVDAVIPRSGKLFCYRRHQAIRQFDGRFDHDACLFNAVKQISDDYADINWSNMGHQKNSGSLESSARTAWFTSPKKDSAFVPSAPEAKNFTSSKPFAFSALYQSRNLSV